MSARATFATTVRLLRQLRRDHRTMALVLVVPPVLLTLLRFVFDRQPATFDRVGPPLVGLFPFIIMFLITSIAMLRERTGGTLERLMSTPIAKLDLLAGYGLAFALVAAVQASVTAAVAFGPLGLSSHGATALIVLLAVGNAVLGMALGLLLSAFASTEFQAVQFMPAVVAPQILLGGVFAPREHMAHWLQRIADVLPFTYAFDALQRASATGRLDHTIWRDIAVIGGCIALALVLGATTLRRRTP